MTEQPDPVKNTEKDAKPRAVIDENSNSAPQPENLSNGVDSSTSTPTPITHDSKTSAIPISSDKTQDKKSEDSKEKKKEKSKKKKKVKPKTKMEKLQDEVKTLKKDLEEKQSKYRYLQAELENTRKYYIKQQDAIQLRTKVRTITAFTPLIDAFENAFNTAKKQKSNGEMTPECQMDNFMGGFEKLYDMLKGIFKSYQVEPIEKTGVAFNYNFHEVMMKTIDDKIPEDTVVQIIQKGYKIKDQVVSPAKVIVSKHSPPPPPPKAEGESPISPTPETASEVTPEISQDSDKPPVEASPSEKDDQSSL
ncbi:MAG: nucleotide exchange factor GrpE [Promethearchaeota archaeon]